MEAAEEEGAREGIRRQEGGLGGAGESNDGEEETEEKEKGEGEVNREEEAMPVEADWMGRTVSRGFPPPASVLSPFAAARRERILLLPGWVRAFKPWGDFLEVRTAV